LKVGTPNEKEGFVCAFWIVSNVKMVINIRRTIEDVERTQISRSTREGEITLAVCVLTFLTEYSPFFC